ncbi:MAG: NAD(P)H-dependent oxidoreductase subunit E [bacterium]
MSYPEKDIKIRPILEKYREAKRESLIPLLQDVQEADGFLSFDSLLAVSRFLNLPLSKVYSVASFYNQFKFQAPGKNHIQVCRGTACHVKGSSKVLDAVKRVLKVDAGQTTRDGLFSLEVVACVGACSLAPVVCINGEYFSGVTPESLEKILEGYRK